MKLYRINKLLKNFKNLSFEREKPYDLRLFSIKDFKQVPLSSKEILSNKEYYRVDNSLAVYTTSGSTNQPLIVPYSQKSFYNSVKRIEQSFLLAGIKRKQKVLIVFAYGLFIAGSIFDLAARKKHTVIPVGSPNITDREKVFQLVEKITPDILCGTPTYCFEIVKHLREKRKRLPKKILCAGEKLTEEMREEIGSYGISVFDNYGCTEIPAIAAQSESSDWMQLLDKGLHIELVDEENNLIEEGRGRLVITDLENFSLPIIRYKLGDEVILKKEKKKKFIKILGRKDNLVKYRGYFLDIWSITEKIKKVQPQFYIQKFRDNQMKEKLVITLPSKSKSKKLVYLLESIKPSLVIKFSKDFKQEITSSGKIKYFIQDNEK